MRRNIKKAKDVSGKTVYIEKRGDNYIPYESRIKASFGIVSPSLSSIYSHKERLRAYSIGLLNLTY